MTMSWVRKLGVRLQAIAFTSGFALMSFELIAARLLAPTVGSSTYVWTSVIGVIIAALSLGYWVGGRLADQRHQQLDIVWISFSASIALLVTMLLQRSFLEWMAVGVDDARIQGLAASLVLFAPVSFLLGMLSPYLVKLNVTSLDTSGRSVASLSALNSIGGIAGTFVTGFVLFGVIGSQAALVTVLLLIVLPSWLILPRRYTAWRILTSAAVISAAVLSANFAQAHVIDVDTPSAHYRIINYLHGGREARGLVTGPHGVQSAVYADGSNELVFWYTREVARIIETLQPRSLLVLGGGSFTLPQYIAERYPSTDIDVVEIDPALENIATQHFNYQHPQNVQLHFTDARAFLSQADKTYDMIVVDVYGDASIPFQLLSHQYGTQAARRLNPGGAVIANVIASLNGACSQTLSAVSGSYQHELPHAMYSSAAIDPSKRANYIVAYTKEKTHIKGMQSLDMSLSKPYSDDFVPAERMHQQCIAK